MKYSLILFLSILIPLPVQSAAVANWKVFNGTSNTSGLNTSSPTFGDGTANDADNTWVAGSFTSYTLNEGQSIILSGSVNMSATTGGAVDNFRFGLWDDNGGFASNDSGSINDWDGFIYFTAQQLSITAGRFVSNDSPTVNYGGHVSSGTFTNNSTADYVFNMEIVRGSGASAGLVDITASLTGGDNGYSSVIDLTDISAPAYITDDWTFNAAGFLFGGNLNLSQAQFSNVELSGTAIPEPSSVLMVGLGATLTFLRRRRS